MEAAVAIGAQGSVDDPVASMPSSRGDLIDCIEQGCVIPIVGRDLLAVQSPDGKEVLLERNLAERLAERLAVAGTTTPGLLDAMMKTNPARLFGLEKW